jgi:hypothetical protein
MRVGILGAGALGAGVIAPLLLRAGHDVTLVDRFNNPRSYICRLHQPAGVQNYSYDAVVQTLDQYERQVAELTITCLRPAPWDSFWARLADWGQPILSLENAIKLPHLSLVYPNLHLGVADVLACTHQAVGAWGFFGAEDPASERGAIYVPQEVMGYLGEVPGFKCYPQGRLRQLWAARFLTHNTGHAVLGMLGKLAGYEYVCEAAQDEKLSAVARQAMYEAGNALDSDRELQVLLGLTSLNQVNELWKHYWQTEIGRYQGFADDTIERITRGVLTKLEHSERLVAPAKAFLRARGLIPHALCQGIAAAIQISGLAPEKALREFCYIQPDSSLGRRICQENT